VFIEFCEMAQARIPDQEASDRLALLRQAELLPIESGIMELAASLVQPGGPLPHNAELDALHWAVAAHYGCDFVLTWNFKHLNNAFIKRRAERIIRDYGYESPTLCSPEELEGIELGGDDA
jgi:PIN domain